MRAGLNHLSRIHGLFLVVCVAMLLMPTGSAARAATFTVNSTGDGDDSNLADGICQTATPGECTLRAAIRQSNAVAGTDLIAFNIPGPGPHIIQPLINIPFVSDPVIIDGYTQPGASPNTNGPGLGSNAVIQIALDGSALVCCIGPGANFLDITGGNTVVRGLAISRFPWVSLDSAGNRIEGNFIGTDMTGTVALGNIEAGVRVGRSDNIIGGTSPESRNVISGNGSGVRIELAARRTTVQGNFIGTDVTGAHPLPNGFAGVFNEGSDGVIGGSTAGARNLISGNRIYGVLLGSGSFNRIEGNYIGTDVTGSAALGGSPQSSGIAINPVGNTIGGSGAGAGNLIAFNFFGVTVFSGTGNAILGNRITSNVSLGIDLIPRGVTPNDAGDADTGPNQLQNFPLPTTLTIGGGNTTISGTLNSAANGMYRLEFFDNAACDASGFGEGETFLGATDVLTDGSGNAAFTVTFPATVAIGHVVTATATDSANNTSEFSRCLAVPVNAPPTANAGGPYAVAEGASVTLAGSGTDPNGDALSFAWDLDNNGTFETAGQSPAFSAVDGPSTHTVTLRVCDPIGLCATAATTVAVSNVPPAVDAAPAQTIFSGQRVTVSATFSDPGIADNPWLFSFDWNDASSDTGSTNSQGAPITASHSYFVPGDYTVKVCVTDKDGGSGCDTAVVSVLPVPVHIDIKPGSDPNSINCKNGKEVITVAILSDASFDATTVDHATVVFEGARETHMDRGGQPQRHEEDVNGDGRVDLVLHFRLEDTSLSCGSVDGTLKGMTFGGRWIEGTDAVRMIDK